VPFGS